jgi:hypothetical protein
MSELSGSVYDHVLSSVGPVDDVTAW